VDQDRSQIPRRKQRLIVNRDLQFSVILYSITFAGITSGVTYALAIYIFQRQIDNDFNFPLLLAFLAVVFLVCGGTVFGIYLTHRIAGPIYKLQEHMTAHLRGEKQPPIVFRKSDFFSELAEPYNSLVSGNTTQATSGDANRTATEKNDNSTTC
jgi:hypothetical protein